MNYLDIHQHYGLLRYRGTNIEWGNEDPNSYFERLLIEKCKKLDLVVAVNGCGVDPHFHLINMNDKVEKFFKSESDYIIGVGYIDLDYDNPNHVDDLYNRGFKAIKVIWPAKRYDSKDYFEIYKRCQYYKLPILFHTGICAAEGFNGKAGACSYNMHPLFLEAIGLHFPELQIIGAHLGTGNYDTACAIADASNYANKNIKFDISAADHYREKIKKGNYIKNDIPVESVLWGLDEPPSRYEEQIKDWEEYFDSINLSVDEKKKIFYQNALKVLKL